MTTNRIGVKFLIAAATAGALVAVSTPGAMAAPPVNKPAKKTTATVVLKSVDIKGHAQWWWCRRASPAVRTPKRALGQRPGHVTGGLRRPRRLSTWQAGGP